MRILYVCTSQIKRILNLEKEFERLSNLTTVWFSIDSYTRTHSYLDKKKDELCNAKYSKEFYAEQEQKFIEIIEEYNPDQILFFDFPISSYISLGTLMWIHRRYSSIVWFIDRCSEDTRYDLYYPYFSKIYTFEPQDVTYLKNKFNINAEYCPVGYNCDYEINKDNCDKTLDIAFIGYPYKNRLQILERVAKFAFDHRLKMAVYGIYYEEKYFWKKRIFKLKYPYLSKFVNNQYVSSKDAAQIYRNAKICLNIHNKSQSGINPRTFEILATGSFEICDFRNSYNDMLKPNNDLVQFSTLEELLEEIQYFLKHDSERNRIAMQGKKTVCPQYSLQHSLKIILKI